MSDVESRFKRRISWPSIFAGTLIVLAISFLLSILGIALGFSMLDPLSTNDIGNGSGTTLGIWTGISLLVSLAIGGFVTGKLAGIHGAIHGFLVWCLALIVGLFISISTLNNALNLTGSLIGSVTSATGSVASSLTHGASQLLSDADLNRFLPNSSEIMDSGNKNVINALEKSGIPELQPDYLNSQRNWAKDKTQASLKEIAVNPQKSDEIINNLVAALKDRVQTINHSISKEDVKQAITKNSNMTSAEADRAVENFLKERDMAVQKVNQAFDQVQTTINSTKEKYEVMKQEAREKAAIATKAAAKAALWAFIGLFIGALVSSFSGRAGERKAYK